MIGEIFETSDAVGLAALIRSGELTAAELAEEAIRRIEAKNPRLNAIVYKAYDQARRRAAGPLPQGPLSGVPFVIKDLFTQHEDFPVTNGSRFLDGFVGPTPSLFAERMKAAGLVALGKSNVPEMGAAPTTEPAFRGPTINPWSERIVPGGSSGGSAVAVASAMVPIADASDGGGSIRIPASVNGLVGLKPSRGRVPYGPDVVDIWYGAAVFGCVSRSVRDTAAFLDAVSGGEVGDPYRLADPAVPYLSLLDAPAPRLTIGFVAEAPDGTPLDPEARSLFDTLAEQTAAAIERAALSREMGAVKAAAETERVRNTLLASISHDFRTPLASILGASTTLIAFGDKMASATRADMLTQIKEEAEHLDRMVRDLLAITRLEAGGLELRRDWLDLRETAGRVAIAARRRAPARVIEVAGSAPLIEADATLIEQALSNIVENALRHGGPEARVAIAIADAAERVVMTVTDDGAGIAPEALPHIFEKFASAGAGDRRDGGESTGLGLAIAKGIVEAHGGTIEAESPVDGSPGARFTITLPKSAERQVE